MGSSLIMRSCDVDNVYSA